MSKSHPGIESDIDGYIAKHGDALIGRMIVESAKDTSDQEIERTLGPCVCGPFLIELAKRMRSRGLLILPTPQSASDA